MDLELRPFNWGRGWHTQMFGQIRRDRKGNPQLELSLHSKLALARENNARLTENWEAYIQ